MNRIQLRVFDPENSDVETTDIDQGLLSTSENHSTPHTLFLPLHYERNYAYPLLVWLHGPGGDEHQLRRIMPLISLRNYMAVAPRGPRRQGSGSAGFDWGHSEASVAEATQSVFESIDSARQRYNVASHRVFLAGYEDGGTMAFRIGMAYPERFAGVLSVGGAFPSDGAPLACLRQARGLPLLIAQGRDSQRYPLERICDELRLFHAADLAITLRQYPCGDELNTQMLHDIDVWLMEQVTGVVESADDDEPSPLELN